MRGLEAERGAATMTIYSAGILDLRWAAADNALIEPDVRRSRIPVHGQPSFCGKFAGSQAGRRPADGSITRAVNR